MSKYLIFAMAVVILGMAAVIAYLKADNDQLNRDIATERANVQIAKSAVEEQRAELQRLIAQRAADLERMNALGEKQRAAEVERDKAVAKLQRQIQKTHSRALEQPERLERIIRFNARRGLRDLCKATGGSKDDCKIESVRPAKTRARAAAKSGRTGADAGGDKDAQ